MRVGLWNYLLPAVVLLATLTGSRECAATLPGGQEAPRYASDYAVVARLGQDLQRMLDRRVRSLVAADPVQLDTNVVPQLRSVEVQAAGEVEPRRRVLVSAGFIDLVNYLAHAGALSRLDRRLCEQYLQELARPSGAPGAISPPPVQQAHYWSHRVMNEQLSNFNQMAGMLVAIELAHHYLGHYRKYADRLVDAAGAPVAIGTLVSPEEWERSLLAAAGNSLNAGLGFEGVLTLFASIEKMPKRPQWTACVLPPHASVSRIRKLLEKVERDYFAGRSR